jgi:hypothetical protein
VTYQTVRIEWYDAFGDATEWTEIKALEKKPRLIVTVGHMLPARVKGYHTVALSYDDAIKHVAGVIHIPEVNVVSITPLDSASDL